MLTEDTFLEILPSCKKPELWVEHLNEELPKYDILSPEEISSFMSQTGHESGHFNILSENLNYSKDGLRKVFPKYFPTDEIALRYARKPEMIANRVYANRMGNGPENSGDGWKFRGRGLIQCTGTRNYTACSEFLFGDNRLLEDPDLLLDPKYAILSACWFWTANKLNEYAGDVERTTKIVNGGHHGLADREAIYERAIETLNEV